MLQSSRSHLSSARESYFQHMGIAFRYGGKCFAAGFMAVIHGVIPGVFCTSASKKVKELAEKGRK